MLDVGYWNSFALLYGGATWVWEKTGGKDGKVGRACLGVDIYTRPYLNWAVGISLILVYISHEYLHHTQGICGVHLSGVSLKAQQRFEAKAWNRPGTKTFNDDGAGKRVIVPG